MSPVGCLSEMSVRAAVLDKPFLFVENGALGVVGWDDDKRQVVPLVVFGKPLRMDDLVDLTNDVETMEDGQ